MKILHRYLMRELLLNGLLTLAAILGIYFILALTFTLGSSRAEGVPIWLVLEYAGYSVISTLYLIVPLTVLSTAIFTYGRASSEGEFTALRVAGIHPYYAILPALVFGAAATLLLAILQDEAMPRAKFKGRVGLNRDIFLNLEDVLSRSEMRIVEKRWKALWTGRSVDAEGNLILMGLTVLELDDEGRVAAETRARFARPHFDEVESILSLTLTDVSRTRTGKGFWSAGESTLELNLESLISRRVKSKRDKDRSYEELLTRSRRMAEEARVAPAGRERRRAQERSRESLAQYHSRLAFAFSALIFGLFGAALGLFKAIGNRAMVFLVGFVVLLGVYYPLEMLGLWLAERGTVAPAIAMWIGNVVLLGLGLALLHRVVRT